MNDISIEDQGKYILAAEDYPLDIFDRLHKFSKYEERIIGSLVAHGPVLIRGGRGSGKSALLIESHNRIQKSYDNIFSVYFSLRHLPLLRSQGKEYEEIFCKLLIQYLNQELIKQGFDEIGSVDTSDLSQVRYSLVQLSGVLKKRIVLFFDDAAHIGRETSLAEFFDIFRTISSSTVACKAAIYPGVTKFGTRFDVYNDASVIDIIRHENMPGFVGFFEGVINIRYPNLLKNTTASLEKENALAGFLGRAVNGNMRALIFACNKLTDDSNKVELADLTSCLLFLASDYYWPLLEELSPKLGVYDVLIEPSRELAEKLFSHVTEGKEASEVATSVLVHRDLVQKYAKLFEILEYTGFISRREVSRAMKSGGRGSRYILNLCILLENTKGAKLSSNLFDAWLLKGEPSEIHRNSSVLTIELPELPADKELGILKLEIDKLKKSRAYPYGLTESKVNRLTEAGYRNIGQVAAASDNELSSVEQIGERWLQRVRDVVGQAIWM